MGLKNLFFEQVPDTKSSDYDSERNYKDYDVSDTDSNIDYSQIDPDAGFIETVYGQNNLLDTSRSIYKVEEISATLPDTLPINTKRESVIGILSSFNLSTIDMEADANERIDAIQAYTQSAESELNKQISDNEVMIEEYKQKITDLQAENSAMTDKRNSINAASSMEVQRINGLLDFIIPTAEGSA